MYVADEDSAAISVFAIGADGSLTSVSCSGCGTGVGTEPAELAITPDGHYLYADDGGSLSAFSIQSDGSLEPLATCGTGCDSGGDIASGGLAISPSGSYLYAGLTGDASIEPMSIAANGSITPIACAECNADDFLTGGMAISPDGSHLYATGGVVAADITVFSIDPGGALTNEPCTAPAECSASEQPIGVTLSPSGGDLYAVDYVGGAVLPFTVLGDGLLNPISCTTPPADCSAGAQAYYIQSIVVQPDQGPVAALKASAGTAGSPTELNASGSAASAAGEITKYDWSFGDGASATTSTPDVDHTYATARTYTATVTVTDEDGCSGSIVFTGQTAYCNGTPAATATDSVRVPSPPLPAPRLTHVGESNKRWRDGDKLAGLSRARRRKTPVGTTFSFTLNEAARVSLTFTRATAGRREKSGHTKKCVKATKRNRKDRRCTLTKTVGALSSSGRDGVDEVSFDGRIQGAKKFAAGSYTVAIEAKNAGGAHSARARLRFTVVGQRSVYLG
jgi:DNA-binding beta-propeller fold protein YncE